MMDAFVGMDEDTAVDEDVVSERQLSPYFQRMYICFKAYRDHFFKCRPIIGMDGCFLKGYYDG